MKRALATFAGPALIVVAVVTVLQDFVFRGLVSSQHPDLLGFWLPTYCFLGKTLAAGHIPAWNPHVMGGLPFAADPQSGWMYAPAMSLFSALPCHVAIRWIVIAQPIIGGLGLYGFLRTEGLGRPAATFGGLVFALPLASSRLGLFLPFPSSLAWTAVVLAACSRYLRADTWPRRLVWLGVVALAWGQLAGAYFAHGLVIGTAALAAYVAARIWSERSAGRGRGRGLRVALLIPALLAINAAILLPRIAYLPRTSFAQSGEALTRSFGLPLAWPLKLATSPGAYLGAALLVLMFLSLRSKRHRPLVVCFGVLGLVGFVASLDVVSRNIGPLVEGIPVIGLYGHYPARFGLALLLVLPIAGAIGMERWLEGGGRTDLVWAGAAAALFWVAVPLLVGVPAKSFLLLGIGAAATIPVLVWWPSSRWSSVLVTGIAAVELVVNGLAGLSPNGVAESSVLASRPAASETTRRDPLGTVRAGWLVPLRHASVDPRAYERPGPIVQALHLSDVLSETRRYLSVVDGASPGRSYLTLQASADWPLLVSQRAVLFGLADVQGYNPVQLGRYWRFVRAVSPAPLDYNAAVFPRPPPIALDLLGVAFIIAPTDRPPIDAQRVATEGRWSLYARRESETASVVGSWSVLPDSDAALASIITPGFLPSSQVFLDRDPGLGPSAAPGGPLSGFASYRSAGSQAASVRVTTERPVIVLIRTPYDPNWHATVDDKPAPVLSADYLVQGVAVTAGRHTIRLAYDDPWIGYGLLVSALAIASLLGAALLLRNRPVQPPSIEARSEP